MEFFIASIVGVLASLLASYVSNIWSRVFKKGTKLSIKLGGQTINIELEDIESSLAKVREGLSIERENPKVFISYARKDKKLARKIKGYLSEKGIDIWWDEEEIKPGDSIPKKIDEGVRNSQWFLQIISPESANSEWMHQELSKMLEMEKQRNRKLIIPIVTESVPLPSEISNRAYVNLEEDYEDNMASLVDTIKFKSKKTFDNSNSMDS